MLSPLKKHQNIVVITGIAIIAFLLGMISGNLLDISGANFSGGAGLAESPGNCDTTRIRGQEPTGVVLADPLNFRLGPGLEHNIISVLDFCTTVSLVGRSSDSTWLQVQAPGNLEGWVFSSYIQANVNLDDLEVTTGFGGPETTTAGGSDFPQVSVVIQLDQAVALVSGMPANTDTVAVLKPLSGSGKNITVATGKTDANGNITLSFEMPAKWADGTKLESGSMKLDITAGGDTLTAWLTYYTN